MPLWFRPETPAVLRRGDGELSVLPLRAWIDGSHQFQHPHSHPLMFSATCIIRYLAVPVSLVKLLKVLDREEV